MFGLLLPVLLAVLVALALGGSLGGWARLRVRGWPAAVGSFATLLVLYNPPVNGFDWAIHWGPLIWVACELIVLAVLLHNALAPSRSRVAWLVAGLGVGLNTLTIVANGGYMPVSAAAPAWITEQAQPRDGRRRLHNTTPMTSQTRLSWLGDVILQPDWFPPRPNVVSVGDVLLSVGLAGWAFQTTLADRRRSPVVAGSGA